MKNVKRVLTILLTIIMLVCMAACNEKTSNSVEEKETQTDAVTEAKTTDIGASDIKYPTGPIILVCPWGAGGSTDITARGIAKIAEEKLGVPVVVENRKGGSSSIGTQEVASAEGDGTTILVATINALAIMPHTLSLEYTPDNFKAIGQVSVRDMAIFSQSSKPWNDINDFIEDAKENPGEYLIAVPQGGLQHLLFQRLCDETGIDVTIYPISGDAEGLTAVLGGVADIIIPGSFNVVAGQLEAGVVKALASFSDRPIEQLPGTPLLIDLGYDISVYPWTTLLVPANTPDDLLVAMQEAFEEVLKDDALIEMLVKNGQTPYYLDGNATMDMIKKQYEDFGKVVSSMDIEK